MKPLPDKVIRAEAYKNDLNTPVTLFFNYPRANSDPIRCGVLFDQVEDTKKFYSQDEQGLYFLQLRGHIPFSIYPDIWIPKLIQDGVNEDYGDNSFRGVAKLFVTGDFNDFSGIEGEVKIYALFEDNLLLGIGLKKHPIEWNTPFGKAKLIHEFRYGGKIVDHSEKDRSKKLQIELTLDIPEKGSLHTIVENVNEYLNELMWFFSFLCRAYVQWYQLDIVYTPSKDGERVRLIKAFSDPSANLRNPPMDDVVILAHSSIFGKQKPDCSSLAIAIENYMKSDERNEIKKIIVFVMLTHIKGFLEHDLFVIYTAIEMIVDTYSKSNSKTEKRIRRLESRIKQFINEIDYSELSDTEKQQVIEKLPELRRRAWFSRLKDLYSDIIDELAKANVLPESLTPKEFYKEIRQVIRRRNNYIHQGYLESFDYAQTDISLLRFLIGIWILQFLGFPVHSVNPDDDDLQRMLLMKRIENNSY